MDTEQEKMQFLGFFDLYTESYKVIFSQKKIFNLITLTFIPSLIIFFLIRIQVSDFLLGNSENLTKTQHQILFDMIYNWPTFFIFLLFLSLFSTSAVVYTVASFYTNKEVTCNKVTVLVPKVQKRLVHTFLCTAVAYSVINLFSMITVIGVLTIGVRSGKFAVLVIIAILYLFGSVYLTTVWQLSSVVTVLEDLYGFEAMMKGKELIKGKMGLCMMIALKFNVSFLLIQFLFSVVVANGWKLFNLGLVYRIVFGIVCSLMVCHLLLLMLVIQSLLYFVCKSYNHEIIDDKFALLVDLQVYEPIKG